MTSEDYWKVRHLDRKLQSLLTVRALLVEERECLTFQVGVIDEVLQQTVDALAAIPGTLPRKLEELKREKSPLVVDLKPGIVAVSSISILHESKDAILLHVECSTKRCEVSAYGEGDGYRTVLLGVGAETVYLNHDYEPDQETEIRVSGLDGEGWVAVATSARYGVTVALMREGESRAVWPQDPAVSA